MEDDRDGDVNSHSLAPLQVSGGQALSDSEKAQALADNLETHFQPVDDPSEPTVIEMVNEAMRAREYTPTSEPKLTIPSDVLRPSGDLSLARLWARTVFRTGP
jgi:hypothetical protein